MKILILLSSLFLSAFANAEHRYGLREAVHELDQVTSKFLYKVERGQGYAHLSRDVSSLASRASRFHSHVENGASNRRLNKDLRRFSRQYNRLVREFSYVDRRGRDRHVNRHGDYHGSRPKAYHGSHHGDRHRSRDANRHNQRIQRSLNRVGRSFERVRYAMSNRGYSNTYSQRDFYRQKPWANGRRGGWSIGFSVN